MSAAFLWPTWLNGKFLEPEAPAICAEDPGFLLGVAVYDTLLVTDQRPVFVEEHVTRLAAGACSIGIELSANFDPRPGMAEVATRLPDGLAVMRLTLTPGAPGQGVQLVITTRGWATPPAEGVRVQISDRRTIAELGLGNIKTTNRARNVLARTQALEAGAYEALLCTPEGDLSEGTVTNLFLLLDGVLVTPGLERGCLPGIVRQKVLEMADALGLPLEERRVPVKDLEHAQEVFLTSSLARILPVLEVMGVREGLPVGGGPHTRRIQDRLRQLEGLEVHNARQRAK